MAVVEHVFFNGQAEKIKTLINTYRKSGDLKRVQEENGCHRFEFFIDPFNPDRAVLVEHWESEEALDAHHNTAMMRSLLALIEKADLSLETEKFSV